MAAERIHASQGRLSFLDWTRGIGALIMLQGHVTHSFMAKDLREGTVFVLSQFVGGMPPAFFLLLTGVTLGFLMDSLSRKEPSLWGRFTAALHRARYLILVAILFRLQMYVFGLPWSQPADILRVDILNCMGFTIAALSWLVAFDTRQRVLYGAVVGLLIACASPVVNHADWSGVPELVRNYLKPDPASFSFFPWGAFLAFGVSMGSVIRIVPAESYEKMMQWAMLLGFALILTANYFSGLPYSFYTQSDFWLDAPGLILIKTGVVMLIGGVAWVWMAYQNGRASWVATLGQHSLPVYWVHIELVYGRWLSFWKESLSVPQTMALAALIIAAMVAMSDLKGRFDRGEWPGLRLAINKVWPLGA